MALRATPGVRSRVDKPGLSRVGSAGASPTRCGDGRTIDRLGLVVVAEPVRGFERARLLAHVRANRALGCAPIDRATSTNRDVSRAPLGAAAPSCSAVQSTALSTLATLPVTVPTIDFSSTGRQFPSSVDSTLPTGHLSRVNMRQPALEPAWLAVVCRVAVWTRVAAGDRPTAALTSRDRGAAAPGRRDRSRHRRRAGRAGRACARLRRPGRAAPGRAR